MSLGRKHLGNGLNGVEKQPNGRRKVDAVVAKTRRNVRSAVTAKKAPPSKKKGVESVTVGRARIIEADALTGLAEVAGEAVQVCATSPPFYLLRSYGTKSTWPDGWVGELGHESHPNEFMASHLKTSS